MFNAGRGMQASPLWARIPTVLSPLIALVLALVMGISSGCSRLAAAPSGPADALPSGAGPALAQGRLQEVAPPPATVALVERLGGHAPQVEILAPADDSLLGDGPWSLQLRVRDWPLADAGSLGLGPHLVVQLDQQEPRRISDAAEAASIPMPALSPGSHRITVYAARPWGEAVKSPGAMAQIRVHRVGRNPAELPARGSAQLIVASPDPLQQQEPVLIDWLLLEAPLQHLRDDDARWRLRVSVNGDSFLVDRQTPLWLKGFRRGSNAVQLELLDGRGEPLNPPFNSLVREVVIGGGERPAWLRPSLSPGELALLSGDPGAEPAPVPLQELQGGAARNSEAAVADAAKAPAAAVSPPAEAPVAAQEPAPSATGLPQPLAQPLQSEPGDAPSTGGASVNAPIPTDAATGAHPSGTGGSAETGAPVSASASTSPTAAASAAASEAPPPAAEPTPAVTEPQAAGVPASTPAEPFPPISSNPGVDVDAAPAAAVPSTPSGARGIEAAPQTRISAGTSLSGSARDQVSADGSLLKPRSRGPLAGLREKLGG